jgi:hypothetical protein
MMQKAFVVGMALGAAVAPFAAAGLAAAPALPPPFATPSAVNFSKVTGWPEDRTPEAPPGFTVSLYADGLDYRAGCTCCQTATCSSPKRGLSPPHSAA